MKKIYTTLLLLMVLMLIFSFSACTGGGKSAYDIWLEQGHTGTESDFLDWLKGEQGEKSDAGLSAYELYKKYNDYNGTEEEWINDFANGRLASFSVTFDSQGGNVIAPIIQLAKGSKITAPAMPVNGKYSFIGWYKERACLNAWAFEDDIITSDITLYAKWSQTTYDLRFSLINNDTEYSIDMIITNDTDIIVPEKYNGKPVTNIGFYAFYDNNAVNISIPSSIKTIHERTFIFADSVEYFYVDCQNANFMAIDGVLFSKNPFELLRYPSKKADSTYIVPTGVKAIGIYAFKDCILEDIILPQGLKTIRDAAFYYCVNLENLIIPDSLNTIENGAFYYCSSLKQINIPKDVTVLGYNAFFNCYNMTEINIDSENMQYSAADGVLFNKDKTKLIFCLSSKTEVYAIPSSVTSLNEYAFYRSKLTSVVFSEGITEIPNDTFQYSQITYITIPNHITVIGKRAFDYCQALETITFEENSQITEIGDFAFFQCSIESIIIPASITHLKISAFLSCEKLKTIFLERSIKEHESITGLDTRFPLDLDVNINVLTSVENIYVADEESLAAYQADEYWSVYASIISVAKH